ncbi:MAG TPA: hypothetical protein VNL37_02855 [Candidatus Polarisedimenticolia bacterium]|nr:hypothetical protein [Candidatus Polarisedimenticolia bacterium]
MKRILVTGAVALVLALAFAATPASAQVMKESTCTDKVGDNTVTYDCKFHMQDYVLGSPVTFTLNYACTGTCGPVVAFGLRNAGFTPAGVTGRMVSGRVVDNGLELTFAFDSLNKSRKGVGANAQFSMSLYVDDGTGHFEAVPYAVNVHLNQ